MECNAKRKELGLKELTINHFEHANILRIPSLHLYSSVVCPRPLDWPLNNIVLGYIFLEEVNENIFKKNNELPKDCQDFLEREEPPIFLSFGSMVIPNFADLLSTLKSISEAKNQRFIVGKGWSQAVSGLYHKNIYLFDSINHNLIFPKCSAVIHHGGAGTTGAGLRAGKPTGIFSFFIDQHFWGECIKSMGVGTSYRFVNFNENLLSKMIDTLNQEEVILKAQELGRAVQTDLGLNRTLAFIENYFRTI